MLGPENIEIALEALRKDDIGLNAASHSCTFRKDS
jgi:hypothetical protein